MTGACGAFTICRVLPWARDIDMSISTYCTEFKVSGDKMGIMFLILYASHLSYRKTNINVVHMVHLAAGVLPSESPYLAAIIVVSGQNKGK